jgi:3-methyladenine DNA glycosylase Tag
VLPFAHFHERALARHGEAGLAGRIPTVRAAADLRAVPDDRYLAAIAKRVFAAGFRWQVIEAKWPGFEEAFHGFDPAVVAGLDAVALEALAADARIVRNRPKILSTVKNAAFVRDIAGEFGSFGAWLADWPAGDVFGLWKALATRGDRLGGDSGPRFLRTVGKDTFRLTEDVVAALVEAGVVTRAPGTAAERAAVERAFTAWSDESGLPRAAVSAVLACSSGPVRTWGGAEE